MKLEGSDRDGNEYGDVARINGMAGREGSGGCMVEYTVTHADTTLSFDSELQCIGDCRQVTG